MNVKGIGEKSFLKLKPLLTISDKADPDGASSSGTVYVHAERWRRR
jgi:hypothetical protein